MRTTSTVRLIPITASLGECLQAGPERFDAEYEVRCGASAELTGQIVAATLQMHAPQAPVEPWCGYLAADRLSHRIVGTCAFKGAPTADGVEIAYFTFPPSEGQGYGTAMAAQLVQIAGKAAPGVRLFAQTLPEASALTRILEKTGFRFSGAREHPEDGHVWEWERLP